MRGLLLLCCAAATTASAQSVPSLVLRDTAVLVAPRLGESSGLAPASRPGTYWTINDSGNAPILYLTDSLGADRGSLRVAGARNVDWEDLAAGPCPAPARGRCLYVGDTGDNASGRESVTIYVVREPEPPAGPGDTLRSVPLVGAARVRYPAGPRDAEGLAVRAPGVVLLSSKPRAGMPGLYEATLQFGRTAEARLLGELPVPASVVTGALVTGIALEPGGDLLSVRTYRHVHLFRLRGSTVTQLSAAGGLPIPVVESQGEAITFEGPGRLALSSERGFRGHAILTRLTISGVDR
jgi:hypothetical protein